MKKDHRQSPYIPPESTFRTIVDHAQHKLRADFGTLLLYRNDRLERVYASSKDIADTHIRPQGRTYKAFRLQRVGIAHVRRAGDIHPGQRNLGVRTILFIPVSNNGKTLGVLNLLYRYSFTSLPYDENVLMLAGTYAFLGVNNAQYYTEIKNERDQYKLSASMLAHELKTPLTSIYAYSQLIDRQLRKNKTPEHKWIGILQQETLRMNNLITELLESRQAQTSFTQCSLTEIIQRAVTGFHFSHPECRIDVSDKVKNSSDSVYCDPDKLIRVLLNILNNAAKFSHKNPHVIVEVLEIASLFVIKVRDKGKGIPREKLPFIFRKFYKADQSKSGLGLGLYMSRKIIEEHQGSISVVSAVNRGTTVTIQIPKYGK